MSPWRRLAVVAAVAGGMSLGAAAAVAADAAHAATTRPSAQQQQGGLSLPNGVEAGQADPRGMGREVGAIVSAAIEPGGFHNVVRCLVQEDRDSIGETVNENYTRWNTVMRDLHDAWKARYGHDLGPAKVSPEQWLQGAQLAAGTVKDVKQLALAWPVDPTGGAEIPLPAGAAAPTEAEGLKKAGAAVYRELPARQGTTRQEDPKEMKPGVEVGVIQLPPGRDVPAVRVSMIKEGPDWRVDVPNSQTESLMVSGIQNVVGQFVADRDSWPRDEQQAYRELARRILAPLVGVPEAQRG